MSGGTLTGIIELQGFNNSKLVVGKPVIVEDFDWGGVFLYKSGDLPAGVVGINSGINPGYHWVDLIGNFVNNYANANLAPLSHIHDSTEITDLETWASGWLSLQTINASQIVNLVFPAAPVQSVNGQVGEVVLTAEDIGAIASGSITVTTAEITDWETAFQSEFAALIVGAEIDFSQITNIPVESPVNWDDVESKPTFLLDFEALSISSLQGFLYHSGVDIWELRQSLAIADITSLQTTLDGKQAVHPSLSALSTIGDNANTGYFKKTGLNSWQVASSVAWGELSGIPANLGGIGGATLTGDGLLRRDGGNWAIAFQIDWGELGNIPSNLEEVAAIATAGYLKRAIDGTIEAVEEVVKPPRPGTWGSIITYEVGDVPIIIVPEDLVVNQRYISFSTDEAINVNIYCGVGEPPDLTISPPKYSFILRPGKQITDDDFYHNGQAIWAATPSSTQVLNVQIAPAAIDYTGAEDLSGYQQVSAKGQANGYAPLDAGGKIPQANIPAIAITNTYSINTEVAMLALAAETGDVAVRLDLNKSFILQGNDPSQLADWQELLSPTDGVQSVNGQVGTVVIDSVTGTAGALATAKTISSSGDIVWNVGFDGSSDVDGVAAIAPNAVENNMLAVMPASTFKGSDLGGNPENLTVSQVLTILNVDAGATANAPDAFLLERANHTGTQSAATISDFDFEVENNVTVAANTAKVTNATHTGEVVGSDALTISPGVVTNAKLADVSESTLKGRATAGVGNPEDLTAAQARTILNVADGATANSTDETLRDRSTHTGTQEGTTVSYDNTASGLIALEIQGAIDELDGRLDNLAIGTDVQGFSVELEAIASLTSAADKLPYFTGGGTASLADFSAFGRSLVASTDKDTAISLLKAVKSDATGIPGASEILNQVAIDTASFQAIVANPNTIYHLTDAPVLTLDAGDTTISTFGATLVDDADAATARATLGLTIGTNVQAYDAELNAIAGLTSVADRLPYFTGSGTAALATFTAFGRSLVDDADATAARSTLGLVIGTNVQAFDAELNAIAGLVSAADQLPYFTGSGTAALATFTAFGRSLVDDADASTARTTLGLGSIASQSAASVAITGGSVSGIIDLTIADGGTGASTAAAARTNLGLGNVDNTSDANKPISTATQTALDGKLNLTGGTVTGNLSVNGQLYPGFGISTANAGIELGLSRTADGHALMDYHASSGLDYSARIIRYSGVNGLFQIVQSGTGGIRLSPGTGGLEVGTVDITPEEGTFTPILRTASDATEPTGYTVQKGTYLKIGKTLFFWVDIQANSTIASGTGNLVIAGLPFASKNNASAFDYYALSVSYVNTVTITGQLKAAIVDNESFVRFWTDNNSGSSASTLYTAIAVNSRIMVSGSYPLN